jgi:hypothetical protein
MRRCLTFACADIGGLVSAAFDRPAEFIDREIRAVGDFVSGLESGAIFSRLRNGEPFKY